eukprot:m.198741 g.198741  ORF g.198741 m.198741 type:complete len:363 (+) comp10654_c0_seq11:760-1848(+)
MLRQHATRSRLASARWKPTRRCRRPSMMTSSHACKRWRSLPLARRRLSGPRPARSKATLTARLSVSRASSKRSPRLPLATTHPSPMCRRPLSSSRALTDLARAEDLDLLEGRVDDIESTLTDYATVKSSVASFESRLTALESCLTNSGIKSGSTCSAPAVIVPQLSDACTSTNAGALNLRSDGNLQVCFENSWNSVSRPQFVNGFDQFEGPSLTGEGWTQCFGWHNDGSTTCPSYARIRELCGSYSRLLFAGWRTASERSVNQLVRHEAVLDKPFINFLPASMPACCTKTTEFDINKRYSWHLGNPWLLLTKYNNAWSDPGRLWEPGVGLNSASGGHVLSQNGDNAHDVNTWNGDVYFIYVS